MNLFWPTKPQIQRILQIRFLIASEKRIWIADILPAINGEGSCFCQQTLQKPFRTSARGSSVHRRFACCHAGLPVPPATFFAFFQSPLQQNQCRVFVTIHLATTRAAMPALRKGFGLSSATGMTFLSAVFWRDQDADFAKEPGKVLNPVF